MVAVGPQGPAGAARRHAVFQAMGLKTIQRSPAFPLVLTSYKLLEIERSVLARRPTAATRWRRSRLSLSTKAVLICQPHADSTCLTRSIVPKTTRCLTLTRRLR